MAAIARASANADQKQPAFSLPESYADWSASVSIGRIRDRFANAFGFFKELLSDVS